MAKWRSAGGAALQSLFISYRRNNNHAAGRLSDRLMTKFGHHAVFRDVVGVPAGATFRDTILARLTEADAVLVVIGNGWLGVAGTTNRLSAPGDFVRVEIETAIKWKIPILPVLIDGAEVPDPDELPASIRSMTGLQFARVRDSDFDADMERLCTTLQALASRKRIEIPAPAAGDPVTGEHLVLKHTSWRLAKLDKDHKNQKVYGFGIVSDGDPSVLERVSSVLYLLPPAWGDESPKRVEKGVPRFQFKNLAWSDMVVRARVYIQGQGMPVFLSAFVRLTEAGPRVDEIA